MDNFHDGCAFLDFQISVTIAFTPITFIHLADAFIQRD